MEFPTKEEYVGLVEQEVQKVITEAGEANDKGCLMLKKGPIQHAMLNAIKELSVEIEQLKKRIKELEQGR